MLDGGRLLQRLLDKVRGLEWGYLRVDVHTGLGAEAEVELRGLAALHVWLVLGRRRVLVLALACLLLNDAVSLVPTCTTALVTQHYKL